ncbi:uncharacterized protein BDZ99DRAFT_483051 [Mytilinidion resinicola]|uniref:Alpha/beta hydrolase fold-3 domain-containing protein n=1 Tax=Mytilinidion resinicola TaxID=574789 RepID=A0A6A6Y1C7_9PEZI|nr:uncharacterized protein BDZ99DRAFT_483051 [Mytilinidion resinicola]KAF2802323.1 hypothetical protein BDZ99DRAFT_483051 [Mytilinidion resinicola]
MSTLQYAHLSTVNPDFAPLIPGVNAAFKKIWTYTTMDEFRGNWGGTRASYSACVPVDGFSITHEMIPTRDGTEVELRVWRPESNIDEVLPLLFVCHGGGFVVGGHDSENAMARTVCVRNGMAVISVDFRRAPEHKFPTAFNDCYDAYHWIIKNATQLKIDPKKVILGGSSAGASIAASIAIELREEDALNGVIGQLLNIPVTCHPKQFPHDKYELNSYVQNAEAPTINGNMMIANGYGKDQYYPEGGPDVRANPLLAATHAALPPARMFSSQSIGANFSVLMEVVIQVGGMDPLRDEGLAYAEALKNDG